MKMNVKRIAALAMILTFLMTVSIPALALTVYSNTIVVDVEETPVTEEVPVTEDVIVEETIPAEEEEVIEETEPVEEEEVIEETEPVQEEEVIEETEPVEEEEVIEETEPVEEEEVIEETEPVEEEVAEDPFANVSVEIMCEIIRTGSTVALGDTVVLTAQVTGELELDYVFQWEFRNDAEAEWEIYPDVSTDVLTFVLSEDNYLSQWRVRLVLVTPEVEEVPVEETEEVVTEEPVVEEPVVEEPVVEEPVVEEPVVEEPVVEESVVEDPVVEEIPAE